MAIPSDLVLARPARDAILRRALQWGILLRGLVDALRYRSNFFWDFRKPIRFTLGLIMLLLELLYSICFLVIIWHF